MATIMKLRQCQPHDWQTTISNQPDRQTVESEEDTVLLATMISCYTGGGQGDVGRRWTVAWPLHGGGPPWPLVERGSTRLRRRSHALRACVWTAVRRFCRPCIRQVCRC